MNGHLAIALHASRTVGVVLTFVTDSFILDEFPRFAELFVFLLAVMNAAKRLVRFVAFRRYALRTVVRGFAPLAILVPTCAAGQSGATKILDQDSAIRAWSRSRELSTAALFAFEAILHAMGGTSFFVAMFDVHAKLELVAGFSLMLADIAQNALAVTTIFALADSAISDGIVLRERGARLHFAVCVLEEAHAFALSVPLRVRPTNEEVVANQASASTAVNAPPVLTV